MFMSGCGQLLTSALTLLCFLASQVVQAQTHDGPTINMGATGSTGMSAFLARGSPVRMSTRGVLMQATASFRGTAALPVEADKVMIVQTTKNGQIQFCLKIADEECASFSLRTDQLRALANFVANGRTQAFTWPADNWSLEDQIVSSIEDKMVRVGDGFDRDDWIAKELPAPLFARVFRYIDYDGRFVNPDLKKQEAERIRTLENEAVGSRQPEGNIEDLTYVNADFHAGFVAYAYKASGATTASVECAGVPARYRWELGEGQSHAFLTAIEFAIPKLEDAQHTELFWEAQGVFCTAAIFRALAANRKDALKPLLQ
jgi:hypothetical protein